MTKYDVKSPDGISITRNGYYSTTTEAGEALEKWVESYSRQGHYSSNMGRIPLEELALHCELETIIMTDKEAVDEAVQESLDDLFSELVDEFHLENGDISPNQMQKLESIQDELSQLLLDYVNQNIIKRD
tara:strand:+ start:1805 stop:2194 length:390 start_codon:yes stop_codon:yes gene_type:complete